MTSCADDRSHEARHVFYLVSYNESHHLITTTVRNNQILILKQICSVVQDYEILSSLTKKDENLSMVFFC